MGFLPNSGFILEVSPITLTLETFQNRCVSKVMARPPDSSLDRLRRQVWIRALRIDYNKKIAKKNSPSKSVLALASWAELGRLLIEQNADVAPITAVRLQGLLGIVNKGNDPRRTILRIPVKELAHGAPQSACIVKRRPSGRSVDDDNQSDSISYAEIPINLVECGETLCPGSDQWLNAYLWELTKSTTLPSLEDLRLNISWLKQKLDVCISHEMLIERYRNSLQPFAELPTANSLSLLAALTTESYITGQVVLLELHRECFYQGCKLFFSNPEFSTIRDVIDKFMIRKIVQQEWNEPFAYHISSLNSPFIFL
jgi:hypothetical protein